MVAPLTPQQEALLEQLRQHLTALDNRYDFARRLARENDWPLSFAFEVITAYTKFLFLAKEAAHPVVPPPYIDKAWHLHLLHTEAYWSDLCPNILQKPFHHEPALRSNTDAKRLSDRSTQPLESYRQFFGDPEPIWLASKPRQNRVTNPALGFLFIGVSLGSAIPSLILHHYAIAALCGGIGLVALLAVCLAETEFQRPHAKLYLRQALDKRKTLCSGNSSDATASGGGFSCGGH